MNEKVLEIYRLLKEEFGEGKCELDFYDDYSLMVAVILSAQCTDKRVNQVTKTLFNKYPNFNSLANAKKEEVEKIIMPCGFYNVKSKNIISASQKVVHDYNSVLPNNMDELLRLPGVGRKTANVLLSNIYNIPSIAVDTHVFRVSNRLGLVHAKNVYDCELQLQKILDKEIWSEMHHLLVLFGRYICKARKPSCEKCSLKNICEEYKKWNGKTL